MVYAVQYMFRFLYLLPILAATISVQAGPVLSTLSYVRLHGPSDPDLINVCANTNGDPCLGSVLAPGTNWTLNYSSESSATYGVLRSKASAFLTGDDSLGPLTGVGTFPTLASVGGRASFQDVYTIGGGTGTGTLYFTFAVTGTSSQTKGQSGRAQFNMVPVTGGGLDYGKQVSFPVVKGAATVGVPFTFGTPVEFSIDFYALAQIFSWVPGAAATADFSNTAVLDVISVKNSASQDVPSFTIKAASGTQYYAGGIVPEPATGWLMAVGLMVAGLVLSRRR